MGRVTRRRGDPASLSCDERKVARRGDWYADPFDEADLRWWDGHRWTGRVKAVEVDEPTAELPVDEAAETSWLDPGWISVGHTEPAPAEPAAGEPDHESEDEPPAEDDDDDPVADEAARRPRMCLGCSTISHTNDEVCPYCGRDYGAPQPYQLRDAARHLGHSVRRLRFRILLALLILSAAIAAAVGLHRSSPGPAPSAAALADTGPSHSAASRQELETRLARAITTDATRQSGLGLLRHGPALDTTCAPAAAADSGAAPVTYSCLALYNDGPSTAAGYRYTGSIDFSTSTIRWHRGS